MTPDDDVLLHVMRHAMVARIATCSRTGRPSVNPLYLVYRDGVLWLGTSTWTLAARNVVADPRVSLLLEVEGDAPMGALVRVGGLATVLTDPATQRAYARAVARKYVLTRSGLVNGLSHLRAYRRLGDYHAEGAAKGVGCVIEVRPHRAELVARPV